MSTLHKSPLLLHAFCVIVSCCSGSAQITRTAWDWEDQAKRLVGQKFYARAGEAYRKAARLNGAWTDWCFAAGNFSLEIETKDDALSTARECITQGAGKAGFENLIGAEHRIIARILNDRGVYSEGFKHAAEAVRNDPSDAWNFDTEAESLFGLSRFQEAISASSEAIRLSDGKFATMHSRLGRSYFELGNWRLSFQSVEKAAELDPSDSSAAFNAGLCEKRLGYTMDALKWFQEAVRRNPKSETAADAQKQIQLLER